MPPLFHVNAFADRPFGGNPAAVCLLDAVPEAQWLQDVAAQMNLSETAFLAPEGGGWRLRWFTPTVEVELCGHATLASAHVLWETRRLEADRMAHFFTRSGELSAERVGDRIELDFPALPAEPCESPPGLTEALGAAARAVFRSRMDYLVELDAAATLRRLKPDFARLAALPVRGVIVTARADSPDYDFLSRFFAPGTGVAEDPVTGSSHCCLGPFWASRLGKSDLRAYQASARGGAVDVRLAGGRVRLGGRAVTVLRGELCV
jgi:predicted PhzF superfamily epimerase YddE/YHI9